MSVGIKAELQALVWALLIISVAGFLTKQFSILLNLSLAFYIIWHMFSARIFYSWVKNSLDLDPPQLRGGWKDLVALIVKRRDKQIRSLMKMRQVMSRNSQLTHAIDEGIIVLKNDLSVRWWNNAAKIQFGLVDGDIGRSLISLIRDPALAEYLKQESIIGRIELPSKISSNKWLMLTASRFGDRDIVLIISDITLLKNAERLRKEFVGNVSHELRTPITVLKGYLETLSDSIVPEDSLTAKAYAQMSEQVLRMQSLADDLILLSKLESQTKTISKEEIILHPLIAGIIEEAKVLSEDKHSFSLICPTDIRIFAQETDIHSVIGNLVVNAVSHNPAGANIEISVFIEGSELKVCVKDDGIGVSTEAIPKLTERFFRTDTSRNSKVGGTGLGLAIVKHIMTRYEGIIEIKGAPNKGAEFICCFPIKITHK